MSQFKLIAAVVCLSLLAAQSVFAQPGWGRYPQRYYYGYAPPVYAYPPVVVPPPPIIVGGGYNYPPPAYVAPPPVPVYAPPAYGYGVIGPRGHLGFGYSTPGFGVYLGR